MTLSSQVMRWGVVGTGGIARAFVRDLAALPDATVTAVGSRSLDTAQGFAANLGVPAACGSYDDLVTRDDVDVVYVATPHPVHAANALAAIAAGKHVLVEKPFTMDADEAAAVVAAARHAGVFCMEAMWTRFLPHVRRLRTLLAENAIGTVRTVVADHGQRFTPDPAHRLFDPGLGGGALLDLGIYPVSFASMVLGTPVAVTADSSPAMTGVDATTTAVLRHADGAHALVTCTSESFTPRRAWIGGTEGTIEVDPTFYALSSFTLRRDDGHVERFETPADLREGGPGKGLRFEAAEVARCVRDGLLESPQMPLDETVSIMRTMDAIRQRIGLEYGPSGS